jgi:DNA-binding transcriptional MerR regulator
MTKYSVKQVSKLAGVSVRTLHHYDKIGLLKPAERAESKYRYYYREDLLRLQQILFYKELGFQLSQISEILNDVEFDILSALQFQRTELVKKAGSIAQLIETLDKTIVELKLGKKMKEEEMYAGFTKEETRKIRQEVKQKWGEYELANSEARVGKMSKEEWTGVQKKGEKVGEDMAQLLHLDATDERVQNVVKEHYAWVSNFYEVSKERYLGLSQLYVQDERFTAFYDRHGEGTAVHLSKGMVIFAEHNLK